MLELRFRGKAGRKLKRILEDEAKLNKTYGPLANEFRDRISELRAVENLAAYQGTVLGRRVRFHKLTGDRKRSYAIYVRSGYAIRIVLRPTNLTDDLSRVTSVYVEVINYHQ